MVSLYLPKRLGDVLPILLMYLDCRWDRLRFNAPSAVPGADIQVIAAEACTELVEVTAA